VEALGGGVTGLRGVDLRGGGVGQLGRDVVALDDHTVLRGGLRVDVGVVLTLVVRHEDVGDDLLGLGLGRLGGGLDRVGRDLTGGGGRAGTGRESGPGGAAGPPG